MYKPKGVGTERDGRLRPHHGGRTYFRQCRPIIEVLKGWQDQTGDWTGQGDLHGIRNIVFDAGPLPRCALRCVLEQSTYIQRLPAKKVWAPF